MSRVLHVISGLNTGGAETYLARLAPQLAERGIEQSVVSLSGIGPIARDLEAAGIPLVLLDLRRSPIGTMRALIELTRWFRPDVFQGWMYHGDLMATIAHRSASTGRSALYWGVRCSDMDLDRYSKQLRLAVRACALASRLPDIIIANSNAGKRAHDALGYRPKRWAVIHNGVDLNRFKPDPVLRAEIRAELDAGPETVLAFHIARTDPMKGHMVLIDAMRRLAMTRDGTDLKVVLVGNGTDQLSLPPSMMALGPRRDVARLLTGGDIIVSSSLFGEGFPNALAEGMATGLLPVATDVGETALLLYGLSTPVPPNNAEGLATSLLATAKHVQSGGSDIRERLYSRMAAKFSFQQSVDKFARIYSHGGSTRQRIGSKPLVRL